MTPRAYLTSAAAAFLVSLPVFAASTCSAVTLYLPGSTIEVGVTLPGGPYDGIAVDVSGNVYVAAGSAGVLRVTRQGAVSTWSSALASDLAFASDGTAYGAGRSLCNCIYQIAPDGTSSTLHQDTSGWTWLTVTPDGTLYADVSGGPGSGLYRVDRTTGSVSPVLAGGPGPGGAGYFGPLSVGVDGNLYVGGSPDFITAVLYRLDGNTLTPVSIPPYGYGILRPGPRGLDVVNEANGSQSELWLYNPGTGAANLLAQADYGAPHAPPPVFNAIAYDPSADIIYAVQYNMLWGIHADLSTPTQTQTWGSVKALYRR